MSGKIRILDVDTVALDEQHDAIVIIDQTKLPYETEIISLTRQNQIWEAIYRLQVRGAPAIGVTAGFGIYLAAKEIAAKTDSFEAFYPAFLEAKAYLDSSRPTAVYLACALNQMDKVCLANKETPLP